MKPALVVAGNLILDDIVYEDGSTRLGQAGGAALYVALGACLWGTRVGIASVVGEDYPKEILTALGDKGIDLSGIRSVQGPGLRIWLLYEGRRRQVIHHLQSPSHAAMSPLPADLPEPWHGGQGGQAGIYHLAPMPLATQTDWIEGLQERQAQGALVSLDPFDLIREETLTSMQRVFHRADLLFSSEDEVLLDSAFAAPELCIERLAATTPSSRLGHIILKRGVRGGLAFDCKASTFHPWSARSEAVIDPTGAGDAFAGGVLAGLVRGRSFEEALEHGIVSASFAMEEQGAEGLLRTSPEDCAQRASEWFGWKAA